MHTSFEDQITLFTGAGVEHFFQCLKNIENVNVYECPENGLPKRAIFSLVERIVKEGVGKQTFIKTYSADVIGAFCTFDIPISLYRMEWSIVPGEGIITTKYKGERLRQLIDMGRDVR